MDCLNFFYNLRFIYLFMYFVFIIFFFVLGIGSIKFSAIIHRINYRRRNSCIIILGSVPNVFIYYSPKCNNYIFGLI